MYMIVYTYIKHMYMYTEYWSGLSFPSPEDLPNPGIEPESPVALALQMDSLPPSNQESPNSFIYIHIDK